MVGWTPVVFSLFSSSHHLALKQVHPWEVHRKAGKWSPSFLAREPEKGNTQKEESIGEIVEKRLLSKWPFKLFMNSWAYPWVVQAWILNSIHRLWKLGRGLDYYQNPSLVKCTCRRDQHSTALERPWKLSRQCLKGDRTQLVNCLLKQRHQHYTFQTPRIQSKLSGRWRARKILIHMRKYNQQMYMLLSNR